MDSHKWANRQVEALIEAGVNPLDAQRSVTWVLANMPVGVDLSMWIPDANELQQPLDKVAEMDARAVFYERAEAKGKRILDAGVVI